MGKGGKWAIPLLIQIGLDGKTWEERGVQGARILESTTNGRAGKQGEGVQAHATHRVTGEEDDLPQQ